jgi:hypothetical protein
MHTQVKEKSKEMFKKAVDAKKAAEAKCQDLESINQELKITAEKLQADLESHKNQGASVSKGADQRFADLEEERTRLEQALEMASVKSQALKTQLQETLERLDAAEQVCFFYIIYIYIYMT